MFVVVFEVKPGPERFDEYLALAKHLKPRLEAIDGFIDNERFSSLLREGWVLSLSTWRDEKSVIRWRTEGEHHSVQEKGRSAVFEDYRLRVGDIVADTAPPAGIGVSEQRFDATETGDAKALTITELSPLNADAKPTLPGIDVGAAGLVGHETFESIYNPGKLLLLGAWRDADAADAWRVPNLPGLTLRHRRVRVIRDYGMFDRREAPQFYPSAPGAKTG